MLKTTAILFIPLMFAWHVLGRYTFYRLRRSIGRGKLPNILESKNQFQQLAVLIYCPEMPSKLGQFSGTPCTSRYRIKLIVVNYGIHM